VQATQKISDIFGGFTGVLTSYDYFGTAVASLGDLDGDSVGDLAVGALDNDGGRRGAFWILFLNRNGTVKSFQNISATQGGFLGVLDDLDLFGSSLAFLGDLDGDLVGDIAVASCLDDDGGVDRGAVWILFLRSSGTVKSFQKISSTQGGFTGFLSDYDSFGSSATALNDLDGDSIPELAVGALLDDDGGADKGAVWILFLRANGTVKFHQKISSTQG
jgi:hypothetical protein